MKRNRFMAQAYNEKGEEIFMCDGPINHMNLLKPLMEGAFRSADEFVFRYYTDTFYEDNERKLYEHLYE